MDTTINAQAIKPAQAKQLASDVLTDKRRSISLFKSMDLIDLKLIHERVAEVLVTKEHEAKVKAALENQERELVNNAIADALAQLEKQGLKFNPEEVSKLLAGKVKATKSLVNDVNLTNPHGNSENVSANNNQE